VSESEVAKPDFIAGTIDALEIAGYKIVEIAGQKPWGAYIRLDGSQADMFIDEFFPGLSPVEARLGIETAELSPKILIVAPTHRLSWQFHDRRAERWMFLTPGGYYKSNTDEQGELQQAAPGDVVQFAQGERHRLVGVDGHYTVVAEIWQHTNKDSMSDEDDIVRLADDYKR
jgi:mannose-6-phosphate isomerase-like protein (cupin superfamily)